MNKEERREYTKKYYEKNKEKIQAYRKEKCKEYYDNYYKNHRIKNKEQIKEYKKDYYEKNKIEILLKCKKKEYKEYVGENKEKILIKAKMYYKENKEKILIRAKIYYKKNKKRIDTNNRKYFEENKDHLLLKQKEYIKKNKEKINEYQRNRIRNNLGLKLRYSISARINSQINNKNFEHCFDILGYSVGDLIKHLESKFREGMSWDNYGRNGWHIDHIVPISKFNISVKESPDFKRCWGLNNLQPLWAHDNYTKHAKLYTPFQPNLDIY